MTEDLIATTETVRASSVTGTDVFNLQGDKIGTVDDIVIDKKSGAARYAVMSFGGFFGIGETYHPLPWEKLSYDSRLAGFVVDLDKQKLEAAPRFERGNDPDWRDPRFAADLRMYYGIPPML
ncbi:hypothetical protein DEA8626_00958 [Defluviimonas aquaemixtae]|uniref:PRC-barrel domain-containing protein n=1 Tax=Albidovulum aquaemixtae TaxID=1542388 RepID=A0A2R8B486_9RHOB|nr:PRC-barrel domain-containing protein [Defluviimonas aquaemixtae]SPH17436.1 hypothetical protein DEA8626_00958 [Defluviimonas aquaemixtae]